MSVSKEKTWLTKLAVHSADNARTALAMYATRREIDTSIFMPENDRGLTAIPLAVGEVLRLLMD